MPREFEKEAASTSPSSPTWFARLFVTLAGLLVIFWLLWLSAYVVQRTYVGGDSPATNGGRLDVVWSLLLTVGLIWGLVNVYWAIQAAKARRERAFHAHWLLATACGLAVVGIEAVMAARTLTLDPVVMDYSGVSSAEGPSKPSAETALATAGDPDIGKQVFGKTCITCHGPMGGGMPNLAPSLVGSEFINRSGESAVAGVIRLGRGLDDPNNKSKKVMPARGGNPFLSDADISHLVAFVRQIQTQPATADDDAAAALQLASWVVPTPKRPTAELNWERVDQQHVAGPYADTLVANRRVTLLRALTLGLTSVHGIFLLGLLVLSSTISVPRLLSGVPGIPLRRTRLVIGGWVVACVSWLLIAGLCFWSS